MKPTQIICKRSFRSQGKKIYVDFIAGESYNKFILDEVSSGEIRTIYIFDKFGGYRFHLERDLTPWTDNFYESFYDYFYDNQEIRKLKLKKIENDGNMGNNNR